MSRGVINELRASDRTASLKDRAGDLQRHGVVISSEAKPYEKIPGSVMTSITAVLPVEQPIP